MFSIVVMGTLNPIEQEIHDYLKRSPLTYVSVTDVSKNVGHRKWFNADRNWARPILRRLEMDGWVESNPFGEYRLMRRQDTDTSFWQALAIPGMSLGNTTIVCDDRETGTIENSPETDRHLRGGTS